MRWMKSGLRLFLSGIFMRRTGPEKRKSVRRREEEAPNARDTKKSLKGPFGPEEAENGADGAEKMNKKQDGAELLRDKERLKDSAELQWDKERLKDSAGFLWDKERLKDGAARGDGRACALLGLLYIKGEIVIDGQRLRSRQDDAKAIRYLWQAANLGNYDHAFYLANAYYGGIGITADTGRAIRLYDLCAMTGSSSSAMSRAAFLRYADPERLDGETLRHWRNYRREEKRNEKTTQRESGQNT